MRAIVALCCASLVWAGCGEELELSACDIATKRCQEDVFYAVLRLRGDGFDPFDGVPPIRNVTLAEYQKQLSDRQKAEEDDDESPPGEKAALGPWDVALGLLGLIQESTSTGAAAVNDAVLNVAAFYSSSTREVTVIDRGGNRSDRGATTLLAHELVHAFQDNEVGDFGALSTDSGFAVRALVEGEATLYEHLAGAEIDRVSAEDLHWEDYYQRWVLGLRGRLPEQESTYYAVNWFIYPLGAGLLTRAWLDGGNAGVRHALSARPSRTIDFVAAHEQGGKADGAALSCEVKPPGAGFKAVAYDRFGALQFYAFLAAADVAEADAWEGANAWRDDLLFVYAEGDKKTVVVHWRIRVGSKGAAQKLAAAIEPTETRTLSAVGQDVLVSASNDPELLSSWQGAKTCD